ncbi:uncharacterized protein LOC126836075 isoform X2 [Adelges cooleyi]|uniref:uncharacterized protein LOC126836075 isoform X2 n=1 Tax=Adelges cooleyi TaxID=133065 RepID=UPI00217F732C|nr:uncharacterized protein LOC126836075 isoform X2 [Adelges cooleyi]
MEVFITNKHIELASEHNDRLLGNGLERVIKTIVSENIHHIEVMNFMIAVPEHGFLNNSHNIMMSIRYQICMRTVIRYKLGIGNLHLSRLGNDRRLLTRNALKQIISNALDGTDPNVTSQQMCRFIGLWISTEIPTLYITNAYIDPYMSRVCILKDKNDHAIKYRTFNGTYCLRKLYYQAPKVIIMKLFCILISFVYVNVFANIARYRREVFITNKHIELASERDNDLLGNGLERVIKKIINENTFLLDVMNFTIAVPEHAKLNGRNNIMMSIHNQRRIRTEITHILDFGNSNLPQLGEERRRLTGKALKQIIIHALDGTDPNVISQQMCRFIGLWISTEIPTLYMTNTYIDPDISSVCILMDKSNHAVKYRTFNGTYWQVDVNNIELQIIELKDQLLVQELSFIIVR